MRVLVIVRLSRETDETTSPERQLSICQQWAEIHGHTVVGVVRDLDVSGALSPFERPELGPWLRDRVPEFDVICAWRVDRLSRVLLHFASLLQWAEEHGKTVATVADSLDTSTPHGRMMANILATFAQYERELTQQRVLDAKEELRRQKRWAGGRIPYGYKPVPHPEKGKTLVIDPESATVIRGIAARVLDGDAVYTIAKDLTDAGVLTPTDRLRVLSGKEPTRAAWHFSTIFDMLKSPRLLGHGLHNREVVRDERGVPIVYSEPILDRGTWEAVNKSLPDQRRSAPYATSALLDIVFCGLCGVKLHHKDNKKSRYRQPAYYRHPNTVREMGCPGRYVESKMLETAVTTTFLDRFGSKELMTRTYRPGVDHSEDLREARNAYEFLLNRAVKVAGAARTSIEEQLGVWEAEIQRLEALPVVAAGWVETPTGRTIEAEWTERDTEGRRRLMLRVGFAVLAVHPDQANALSRDWFHAFGPDDEELRQRLLAEAVEIRDRLVQSG